MASDQPLKWPKKLTNKVSKLSQLLLHKCHDINKFLSTMISQKWLYHLTLLGAQVSQMSATLL